MLAVVVAFAFFIASCGDSNPQTTVGVSWKPPFAPVILAINSKGEISIQGNYSIVTPIGTFSLSAEVSDSLQAEANALLVIIRHKQNGHVVDSVYKIETGQDEVTVVTNGTTTIDVTQHKVFIDASKGTVQSIEVKDATTGTPPPSQTTPLSSHAPTFAIKTSGLETIAWSPDGKFIVAGLLEFGDQGEVQIFDIRTGNSVLMYQTHTSAAYALAWSPDGKRIAAGVDNGVQVIDAATGRQTLTFNEYTDAEIQQDKIAWSPNGKYIASTGTNYDSKVHIWNPDTGDLVADYNINYVDQLAWSPDSQFLAIAVQLDNTYSEVQIWKVGTGQKVWTLNNDVPDNRDAFAWSPDGKRVAYPYGFTQIQLWDVATEQAVLTFGRKGSLNDYPDYVADMLDWSPDGKYIASCATGYGTIHVWNVETGGEVIFYTSESSAGLSVILWSPNGNYLASGAEDGIIEVWDAPQD
jgi:WD40 repeat protein